MPSLPIILASLPILAACIFDVRRRIIPDWTVLTLGGIGLISAVSAGPLDTPAALPTAFAASGLCAALGIALSGLGVWGWGDAKLLTAAGMITGLSGLAPLLLVMAATGGCLALLLLLLRKPVLSGRLKLPAGAPRWLLAEQRRLRRAPSVPYGLAIVAGLIAGI